MARSLASPKVTLKISGSLVNTLTDGSEGRASTPALTYIANLESGVNADQANRAWQTKNQLLGAGAQVIVDVKDFQGLDIGGGEGRDALGQEMDLEEIVAIVIVNENVVTSDGKLEVTPSGSEGWTPIGIHTTTTGGLLGGQGFLAKVVPAEAGFDVSVTSHRITLKAITSAVRWGMYILGRTDDEESSSSSSSSNSSSSSSSQSASSLSASSSSISTSGSSSSSSVSSQSSSSSSSTSSSSESSSSLSSQSV